MMLDQADGGRETVRIVASPDESGFRPVALRRRAGARQGRTINLPRRRKRQRVDQHRNQLPVLAGSLTGTRVARLLIVLAAILLATGLGAASIARADILATVEVHGSRAFDIDLATFDVATGARSDPGVNTLDNEFHPSIAHNRLVFQRTQDAVNAIIMKDLATGQQVDLFNGQERQGGFPNDPALAPDGSIVLDGSTKSCEFCPHVISTDVSAFPNGPFPHTQVPADPAPALAPNGGSTADPVVVGTNPLSFLFNEPPPVFNGDDELHARLPTLDGRVAAHATHGTAAPGGTLIIYQDLSNPSALRAIDTANHTPPERLPPPVNARTEPGRTGGATVAIEPSLSSDGRYLAFVRWRTVDEDRRLFVWDSQTQLLLNPEGIELGKSPGFGEFLGRDGNIALKFSFVLQHATIRPIGSNLQVLINVQLSSASNVGIIVQKVIGRTRVFGKPAPKLRFLGRVPLGHFKRGKGHIVWNRKLGGRKLGPGLYQVTIRSLTATGGVRDQSHPVLIRIKANAPARRH